MLRFVSIRYRPLSRPRTVPDFVIKKLRCESEPRTRHSSIFNSTICANQVFIATIFTFRAGKSPRQNLLQNGPDAA